MKKLLLSVAFHFLSLIALADHLVGGELFYSYKGRDASNRAIYKVTLRFFRNMEANVPSIQNEPVYVGIYESQALTGTITLPFEKVDTIKSRAFPGCVNPFLQTIYEVGYFSAEIYLPVNEGGYTLAWARCCRTNAVANMNLDNGGITLTAEIPGAAVIAGKPNNSAVFPLRDTVLLCNGQFFNLSFEASDADGDSLTYGFYPAIHGASINDPGPPPAPSLQLSPLPYKTPQFSEKAPMGAAVTIDPLTGIISGTAPAQGTYLVTVRVYEWREGQLLNQHSKDILLKVRNCSYSMAQLKPEYIVCDTPFLFRNELPGNTGDTWHWDFGVANSNADTSAAATPAFSYTESGTYLVTLIVNKDKPCPSSATATVQVQTGLKAGFLIRDSCAGQSTRFVDTSVFKAGEVREWIWDFGDPSSSANTATAQHPVHTYLSPGIKTIRLIARTEKGCSDTAFGKVPVYPSPQPVILPGDTTLCKGDSLTLKAEGNGIFTWIPDNALNVATGAVVTVFPSAGTTYTVQLDNGHCTGEDSVKITVLPRDSVSINSVSPVCPGDSVQLNVVTQAAVLQWMPIVDGNSINPVIYPDKDTVYKVIANAGVCQTADSVLIKVMEGPQLFAGNDITIAEGQGVQLSSGRADFYHWEPPLGLNNTTIENPYAQLPSQIDSVTYIVKGQMANGCTASDTITIYVNVLPFANAPTAFTPDGNGQNDVFRPVVKGGYNLVDFVVFSRWGELVFQTKEQMKGWDGTTGGIRQATGVYVWVLNVLDMRNGQQLQKKGTVVLIR